VVARWEGRIVGIAAMNLSDTEAHISTLGVLPHFRQRGIGKALLRYLLQWAGQRGVETISLEVRESNLAAQRLYREHGFAPVGRRRQYYTDNGEDALIMVREEKL
jgi:ribosomal-protein-alanine N-acetyltransferase